MKLTAEDGKEYEAEKVQVQMMPKADNRWSEFWLLRPIPKTVTIGGVVWEIEKRKVKRGEWRLNPDNKRPEIWAAAVESWGEHDVLRPLRAEGQ